MKKIMIVDDNEDIRRAVERTLTMEGYETLTASDGDDCLEQLSTLSVKPDLILLDIMMPGTPVAEVIEKIEGGVKIAYLSAVRGSEENKKRMLSRKNVVDFISKPVDRDGLLQIVRELVGE